MSAEADAKLIARVAQGDVDAMKSVFDRCASRVLRVTRSILRTTVEAEDAAQDTFIEIWQRAKTFQSRKASLLAWVSMIARTRSIDRLRSNQSYERIQAQQEAPVGPSESDDRQQWDEVKSGFRMLPQEQQQIIDLIYLQGLKCREAAEQLAIPVGTVKTRLRLGLRKLQAPRRPI